LRGCLRRLGTIAAPSDPIAEALISEQLAAPSDPIAEALIAEQLAAPSDAIAEALISDQRCYAIALRHLNPCCEGDGEGRVGEVGTVGEGGSF
jgi:hypothetical protein